MTALRLAACIIALTTGPTMAEFLLNGHGASGVYQIYRTRDDGQPTDLALVISPSGSGFDATHVFWPSGLRVGVETWVYATATDAGGVGSLGLWVSNGGPFARHGQVLAPIGDEVEIGNAVVVPDPADADAPYKLWYATRYIGGRPREVRFATSINGRQWTRRGTVYAPSHGGSEGGLQISHVCRDTDGTWRLFYTATDTAAATTFRAYEARAALPVGPWTYHGMIASPGGVSRSVASALTLGTRYIPVSDVAGIEVGDVYVLGDNTPARQQRVVVVAINAKSKAVIVEDPVFVSGDGMKIRAARLNKVDPSFFWRDADGVGHFMLTAWGVFEGSASEYVVEMVETPSGLVPDTRQRFKPFGPGHLLSYENPTFVRSGPGCTLD